jgi:adenylosuccinate synthase
MARHHVVFGLGFGDEGKGTTTDYLVSRHHHDYVVRFNGGSQAGHNVVLPDGRHHTFAQYGSGTLQGAVTFLSRFMIVNPITMMTERQALQSLLGYPPQAHVDGRALVTTPYHVGLNQLREATLRHGSCGMGIGETKHWESEGLALRVADIQASDIVLRLDRMRAHLLDVGTGLAKHASSELDSAVFANALRALTRDPREVADMFDRWLHCVTVVNDDWLTHAVKLGARLVFEGAQGVLLDETHGWAPNYTWSTCTPQNALQLCTEVAIDRDDVEVLGVLRAYHTRHGAGPLPAEFDDQLRYNEAHNVHDPWQGEFRWGAFDRQLARYALEVSGRVDGLAITHLDTVARNGELMYCADYFGRSTSGKPEIGDALAGVHVVQAGATGWELSAVRTALPDNAPPVRIASFGPTYEDKQILEVT